MPFHQALRPAFEQATKLMGQNIRRISSEFLTDESGPTTVEYAILLTFIILVVVSTVRQLGIVAQTPFVDADAGLQ